MKYASRVSGSAHACLLLVAFVLNAMSGPNAQAVPPGVTIERPLSAAGAGGPNVLINPDGLALDANGNLYVAGCGFGTATSFVFKVTPGGDVTIAVDGTGDGAGNEMNCPVGMDSDGTNMFVGAYFTNNAFQFDSNGAVTEIIDELGGDGGVLQGPLCVTTDDDGNVYVCGGDSDNVFRISSGGVITELINATGDGVSPLNNPHRIAPGLNGAVFVAGKASHNVFRVDSNGTITEMINSNGDGVNPLGDPIGIDVDASGNLFVAGNTSDNVFKVTPSGFVTEIMGSGLDNPTALRVDLAGNVYVAAFSINKIFRITPGGEIRLLIDQTGDGSGQPGFDFEGPADDCIEVLPDGSAIYAAGTMTNNVFKITISELVDCTSNGDCDDGVGCTSDVCSNGSCINTPDDGNCPDDGLFCNGDEFCDATLGCQSTGDPCGPGETCNDTTDTCDVIGCTVDGDCDDGVGCTDDVCSNGTCVLTPNDANCPDDGLFCTGVEFCDAVQDCTSTGAPCGAGEVCDEDADSCDPLPVLSCGPLNQLQVPGGTIQVEVFVSGVESLNAYQVRLEPVLIKGAGSLSLTSCEVDDSRTDFVFFGLTAASGCNPMPHEIVSIASGAVAVNVPPTVQAYLGTFTFAVTGDAAGATFEAQIQVQPDSLLLDATSNPMDFQTAESCVVSIADCDPPSVSVAGSRYLKVQLGPADSTVPQAIRVTSPDCPSLEVFADTSGCLVDTPQFHTVAEWGTVYLSGAEIVPDFTYEVTSLCGTSESQGGNTQAMTRRWGDVNTDTAVDVIDIQKVLQCAEGKLHPPTTVYNADLVPDCLGPECDVFDVLAVLDAWQGLNFPGQDPCESERLEAMAITARSVGNPVVELVTNISNCASGDALTVDVYLRNAADVRGYQLQLALSNGQAGTLSCDDLYIDVGRENYLFEDVSHDWPFVNRQLCRLSASLTQGGIDIDSTPRYLGSFIVQSSGEAVGSFQLELTDAGTSTVILDSDGQQIAFDTVGLTREFGLPAFQGDTDCNGIINILDYGQLADCLAGPGLEPSPRQPSTPDDCLAVLDADSDGDVDLGDFAAFQVQFTGG